MRLPLVLLLLVSSSIAVAQETWRRLSPDGGFIASVAFHPTVPGTIWASGDDSSGLFRSADAGVRWTRVASAPRDHATLRLAFDPADPRRIYAPNHFGRGLLRSVDGGATWSVAGTGLPGLASAQKRLWSIAVKPTAPATVYVASGAGLFRSGDHGATFTPVAAAAFAGESDFRAVACAADGRVFCGAANSGVFALDAAGSAWSAIVPPGGGIPVADLAVTAHALYIAYLGGWLWRQRFSPAALALINDPTTGPIQSSIQTHLAAAGGASAATDRLYVGTSVASDPAKHGMFRSDDGGASFVRASGGLGDSSVFSLAIDPADSAHVVCGTIGDGVFVTADAGASWTAGSVGLSATPALAAAVDPRDARHLLFSATEGWTGTPGTWETFDGGGTWSEATALPADALALDIDPADAATLLAGTFGHGPGILRSTGGSAGPWSPVLATTVAIDRFVRDAVTPTRVYAVATATRAPATSADLGLYVSTTGGASWTHPAGFYAAVAAHPAHAGEAIAVGGDAVATANGFASAPTSLGLAAAAPSRLFTAVAFDPVAPATVLVGTSSGELWLTDTYGPNGTGTGWSRLTTPARDVVIRRIVITRTAGASAWYVAAFAGDVDVTAQSTPGLMRSTDRGASWSFVTTGLDSSDLLYELVADPTTPARLIGGFWGSGLYELPLTGGSGSSTGGSPSSGGGCGLGGASGVLIALALATRRRGRR